MALVTATSNIQVSFGPLTDDAPNLTYWSAASSRQVMAVRPLANARNPAVNNIVRFAIGEINFTLDTGTWVNAGAEDLLAYYLGNLITTIRLWATQPSNTLTGGGEPTAISGYAAQMMAAGSFDLSVA